MIRMKERFLESLVFFAAIPLLLGNPVMADDCGTDARVSLPWCAQTSIKYDYNDHDHYVVVTNGCSEPITVKFDKRGSDVRRTLQPGESHSVTADSYSARSDSTTTKVSCCKNYSRCSFPRPAPTKRPDCPTEGKRGGIVKWYNEAKGFGFIEQDCDGDDVFVHFANIITAGFKILTEGQKVIFNVKEGAKGPVAIEVELELNP